VTTHTNHVTPCTNHLNTNTNHLITRTNHVTAHINHVITHTNHVITHTNHVITHTNHMTAHINHITTHTDHENTHISHEINHSILRTKSENNYNEINQCQYHTCGMIVIFFRTSCRPTFKISIPSIIIFPDGSTRRNSIEISELFPAPVLPTIPI